VFRFFEHVSATEAAQTVATRVRATTRSPSKRASPAEASRRLR
jgi:hypothetical protein